MSRVAIEVNRSHYGGASQIPRPFKTKQPVKMQNGNHVTKPSRLQQMQAEFQQRQLREKEEKLIQLYEENQMRTLQKVNNKNNNKGVLRDFFEERRAAGPEKNHMAPSMDQMLKQKRLQQQASDNRFGFNKTASQNAIQSKYSKHNASQPYKTSAGRDRSNLLAPIQRPDHPSNIPFPNRPQMVRPRTFGNQIPNNVAKENFEAVPRSAPTGAYETTDESLSDDTPPPNSKNLKALHQKRMLLQSQRSNRSFVSSSSAQSKPVSDFQKWQAEQDRNRDERLRKYRETSLPPPEDEGYAEDEESTADPNDDIKRKQLELIAQIEAQQAELNRLKQERLREEQQVRSEGNNKKANTCYET